MAHTATASAHASTSREGFRLNEAISKISENHASNTTPNVGGVELIAAVVTLFVVLLILSFVGQMLWNAFIAGAGGGSGLLTVARPATSVWQILGLYIFVGLLCG